MQDKAFNNPQSAIRSPKCVGLLIEFETPELLVDAARRVREAGYTKWDAHSPYPVHGMDAAMGLRRSPLAPLVFAAAVGGVAGGYLLLWWTVTVAFPYILSGKPFLSVPAFIPIMFELAILFGALTAVFGMFTLNRMPRFRHPVFLSKRFRRATNDRFFISIVTDEPKFNEAEAFAKTLNAANIEFLIDDGET